MKPKPKRPVVVPVMREDGSCPLCVGGWLCLFHQEAAAQRDRDLGAMLRRVAAAQHANEIARVCARFELESDEGGTREEKAERYLAAHR